MKHNTRRLMSRFAVSGCLMAVALTSFNLLSAAGDPFMEGVRPTPALTPQQEKESFQLPPGFEIELVAAEPDIAKPMNMAFDARGRLWVSDTLEYPFPVPLGQEGRDSIKVLSDSNGDGDFDQIDTFASGLNIPIGLYPHQQGVLAWSIPNIWWLEDSDGDGRADRKEKRFGPLGWERDTHGMNASFTRGFDGWIYATHGFNNNTTIRGQDGSELFMNSGHTYRIRLDGSRVEPHTYGQVNPFGMCLDPLGNFYTADCHSAPVYQLLRGAYYPSFGKPHDGLGFGPTLMTHAHGSTAICGIVFYDDDQWPMEFRENVFIGNVMTSRLNRDALIAKGSSRQAVEMPDLIRTSDPWFRPVNIQLGPDGALYIADFYNKIIGHYEVPLKHPGRDRERGRIWKLSYKGTSGKAAEGHGLLNLTTMRLPEMIQQLGHPNISRRMLATHYLVDEVGAQAGRRLRQMWHQGRMTDWRQRVHALWVMERLGMAGSEIIGDAVHDATMEVRTHAMHLLAERKNWTSEQANWVLLALQDDDANVQRAAADALALHPSHKHIRSLLKVRETAPPDDPQWLYGMRLALRNQLLQEGAWGQLNRMRLSFQDEDLIADVAIGVQSEGAADFLVHLFADREWDGAFLHDRFKHAARFASASSLDQMGKLIPIKFGDQPEVQLELFQSIRQGLLARGVELTSSMRQWGTLLAEQIVGMTQHQNAQWMFRPVSGLPRTPNPWFLQIRASADGDKTSTFLCSLPPGGETYTGMMRTPEFEIPDRMEFYLAGHDGYPDQARKKRNGVRLVDVHTEQILKQVFAPRNDIAQRILWDLKEFAGKSGRLEIVDADQGDAYAWIAFGRLKPEVVSLPLNSPKDLDERLVAGAKLIGDLKLVHLKPDLQDWMEQGLHGLDVTMEAARAYSVMSENNPAERLISFLGREHLSLNVRRHIIKALVSIDVKSAIDQLDSMVSLLSLKEQQELVQTMTTRPDAARLVVRWIQSGKVSPLTLRDTDALDRIQSVVDAPTFEEVKELADSLSAPNAEIQDLIDHRISTFDVVDPDLENGKILFEQACQICHQLNQQGALVGPQLDGVGNRGMERLMEDVLAPNRNMDHAFQPVRITLKDGEIMTGLPRRVEGRLHILTNSAGQEIFIEKEHISGQESVSHSIMPDNFGEVFNEQQFRDLIGYLLHSGRGQ